VAKAESKRKADSEGRVGSKAERRAEAVATAPQPKAAAFEPRVVAFACNWCSYPAADAAGINKMQYPPNARIIRVMCAGRVHPAFVLKALELGADGVLVSGCHFADCHYLFGAKRAAEQFKKVEAVTRLLGLEPGRVRFEQISAAEAPKFVSVMHEFVAKLRELGPSPLAGLSDGELSVPGAVGEELT
jgi:F420-non-reducing hydrogenase iron-sulfur subunit